MLIRLSVAFTTLLSLAAVVVADDRSYGIEYKCGSDLTPKAPGKKEARFASRLAKNGTAGTFTVPVYFHVIYAREDITGGYIPDSQVRAQIDVLNNDFRETSLSFSLQNITRTLNADWFNYAGPYMADAPIQTTMQTAMKTALHRGNASSLNIYTVGFTSVTPPGVGGYSPFPSAYESDPTDDGVVLLYTTLPGGTLVHHNLGTTGTHEVGHWVGLYHTFQSGCKEPGDYVDDTPAIASSTYGCPAGRDTCTGAGLDPIHNYMDYSCDSCRNNFTPGQIARLHAQIAAYRGIDV